MPIRSRKQASIKNHATTLSLGLDLSAQATRINEESLTRAYNCLYDISYTGLSTRDGLTLATTVKLPYAIDFVYYYVNMYGETFLLVVSNSKLYQLLDNEYIELFDLHTERGVIPSMITFNGYLIIADGRQEGLIAWDGEIVEVEEEEEIFTGSEFTDELVDVEPPVHHDTEETSYSISDTDEESEENEDEDTEEEEEEVIKGFHIIKGSPEFPTVVSTAGDRVICNSLTSPDSVFFSEPEQYDGWDIVEGGNAITIVAGFGDGMEINNFAVLYGMLVVSKIHKENDKITGKKLHLISIAGTTTEWYAMPLSQTAGATSRNAMIGVQDSIYFIDNDGIQRIIPSLAGAYGDVSLDTSNIKNSARILPLVSSYLKGLEQGQAYYVTSAGQIWYNLVLPSNANNKVMVYHIVNNSCTELEFPVKFLSICEIDEKIYLGGNDGRLYYLSDKGTDWTESGEYPIYTTIRTKLYEQMGGDIILKGIKIGLDRIMDTNLTIEAVDHVGYRYPIWNGEIKEVGSSLVKIFDAHSKIYNANWSIYGDDISQENIFEYKCNIRRPSLYVQIRTKGGRININLISGTFAYVG